MGRNEYSQEAAWPVFLHASESNYGVIASGIWAETDGRHQSRLLVAKPRVATRRAISIIKPELSTAVLAVRSTK